MKIIINGLLFLFLINTLDCYIYSKNNRLYDENGLERLFRGVNVVYKGYPWYPDIDDFNYKTSFNIDDVNILKRWGFNSIRLGVMWPGLEPEINNYDYDYLDKLEYIVKICSQNDIYVILDFHQDLLSRYFCGEGVPDWVEFSGNKTHKFPYPIDKNYTFINNIPTRKDCDKHYWVEYQFTQMVSSAYQDLYDNYNGLRDKFIDFWKTIATRFKNYNNIIGYELINEPWAGDIFKHPSLLIPKIADRDNLDNFYNHIVAGIREVDKKNAILFESVTWDIYGVGFRETPLNNANLSILSYHAYYPPNIFIEDTFKIRIRDLKRLNIGGFLTEFGYGSGNTGDIKDLENALKILEYADKYIQSWTIWDYKIFYPLTGSNIGFFNSDGSLTNTYYTLSRPYPIYVEGSIDKILFNNKTRVFNFAYKPNYKIFRNTKVYINENLHYPNGYILTITPKNSVILDRQKHYLLLDLDRTIEVSTINVLIKPKTMDF